MKVEIKINPELENPYVVIHTQKLTPEVIDWVEKLEKTTDQPFLLTAKVEDKSFIIEPEDIEIIRTEGGLIKLYNRKGQGFMLSKSLQELQQRLSNNFIRISKSALININRVDHVSPSFNGTMNIVMKNGIDDYISRKYISDFKKRLGL